ncbi:hypothetical protein LAZ67_7001692 [Cordylochernes scorpioides]|uniref:Reverse transcriptase n=1 Tax=Cordylochernes scorpioides TaxID=51811 RepID=A0ABY6KSH9_9ARAC|nr:hypothetical protein LAZ67_7001692 [Cordylochernes scorpioides]
MPNSVPKGSPGSAEQVPERPSILSQPGEEISLKFGIENKSKENSFEFQKYANPPEGAKHVNLAAARGDVTAPKTAASTSATPASPASLNWADSEMAEVDDNEGFIVVKGKKRRLGSTSPEHAARQPNKPGNQRSSQQRKRPTGPRAVPPQEIKATRANIADARARQATTNHENYVFVELCPDIPDYSYLKAMSTLLGGPRSITQFHRMNGHFIVGLADKKLANRLVADGLEIEGTSLRVFPFRKRAERIVVANLPGFVEDSTIATALGQFGKVTSIAPILVKMGEFTFTNGRREAFILLREGVRLETLPTRLTIHSKGDTLSAFLSFGIKCSKCGKQGHRRANCPTLARQGNGSPRQAASPTDARPPLPPPQRPRKPAPAPATPASPVQPAKTSAEAQAIPSAHQPAEQMDLTHPAPAAHPAPLAALRPPELRIPPLDHEMSVEKLSSPPATPARGKAALEQLLEHLGKSPNPSIDWDKLPDLNCEEAQKLLTSETTMKRRAPTLTKEQFTALEKLHETIKALCPDSNSTIRKTLQKTRKETNAFHLGSGQDLCLGYSAVVLAHPVAISGSGLACVFGPGVAVLQQRILCPGHIALATIDVRGEEMTAIAVHQAHEPRERNRQLELLAATAAQEEEGACWIIGDFNIRDLGPSSSSSSDALAALLDLAALVDVATQFDAAHLPTRVAMHGDQVESNRLDRILVPAVVLDRVSIYATSHYHLSDHRLVLLQVGPPTTAVSSPTQPRLAAMLRSGLVLEHLAGYIRELEEDTAHDDDDGILWDRWTTIKAELLAEARSLHDPRHAASDSYIYRARRYIAAQLEASSIRADYPSLPDLARAIRLRRPVSVIRDEQDNIIEGPELRRRAFATFQPRFARPTSDPAAGAAFIASSAPTTTRELSEEDPLHRPDISPSEIATAIEHLPRGKAPGWDGLTCELLVAFSVDFFAEALARVFAESRLRGALPPSICLVPKARGGRGLDGYRPVALPSADYRVLAAILHRRLKPHLRTLVPECQTYAVPGRSPSWNIAMVTDAVEEATALGSPLAVMGVDLESAFDSLDRGFLESLLTSLRLPPAFRAWINILYAGADATIRAGGFYTAAFPLLNGLRQGCAVSAALFSIATGPLLRRLELTLGVGNVIAYADDIVLLFHRDGDFERVATVFEEYKQASGVGVNLRKSAGLWCGAWRNSGDSPLGASWSTTSIRILGLDIAPRSTVAHREQHLLALLETACRRWTPFTRGLSLVGRARAANTLVGSTIQHHLHGYLPSPPTIAKLQARLARPHGVASRQRHGEASCHLRPRPSRPRDPAPARLPQGGTGRGGRNSFSWLVGGNSGVAWIHPPPDGTRLQPRCLRLLKLWEEASNILGLNHRAVPTAQLLDLPIIGGCRFLRSPDLLAPARWRGARVRDLLAEDHLTARPTRSALADAAALGAFCRRLTSENAVGFGAESTPSSSPLAAAVVLRGTATPFLNGLTTRSARRALDRPRLAATPISRFTSRWSPTISPLPSRIDWASLRRCAFSGHEADAALKLALHALPHPAHPASVGPSCPACGSIDRSLGHRYWCCRSIRPLIREAFNIIGRPPDLQAWIFGGSGLENDALSILASAKLRIYRYFVQVGLGEAVEDPLIAWSRTLQRRGGHANSCRNWADCPEQEDQLIERQYVGFTKVGGSKKRPHVSDHAKSGTKKGCIQAPGIPSNSSRPLVTPRPSKVQEYQTNRQKQATFRARSAAGQADQYVYLEFCPDFTQEKYFRVLEVKIGKGTIYQLTKMKGHILVGLSSVQLADKLVEEGLNIEYVTLRAFPLRKRAERIVLGNVLFFVEDADLVTALRPYGQVTSIIQKIMQLEDSCWAVARREAFITLRDGVKLSQIPARLDVKAKGVVTHVYVTYGISVPCATSRDISVPTVHARLVSRRTSCNAALRRRIQLCCFLKDHEIDVCFLQETNVISLDDAGDLCHGYLAVVAPATTTVGSGLACVYAPGVVVHRQQILWPGNIEVIVFTVQGVSMTCVNAHVSHLGFYILCVYNLFICGSLVGMAPTHAPEERCRQLQIIAALANKDDTWILGDLNISEESAKDLALADLVDVATFFDAALEHTRVATTGSRIDARRLDRILLPSGFCDRVTHYQIIDYAYSDHRAVLIHVRDPAPTRLPCIGKLLRSDLFSDRMATFIDEILEDLPDTSPSMLWEHWNRIKAELVAEIRSLAPAVAESGSGYIERASLFLRRRLEDDTARSDYPSLSDLGRSLRARRRSPSTFTDDDGNAISGGQLRGFLLERLSSRFAQAPSLAESIADFLAEVTPLEFDEWDQLFLADIYRDQIAASIHSLSNGRASGWDGLPCEFAKAFEQFFAEVLWQVFEASRLRGALPSSTRRSKVILLPKSHGGPGLQPFRPISLPTTDYRVLSGVLMGRLRRHLPNLAVPGRSSSWNIAQVADSVAWASRYDTPLAVISLDLKSAFDTLSRSYLFALLEKLGLKSGFLGWITVLYGEADASIRIGDVYTRAFPLLNGVRQSCRLSAALFSIGVGPLLRRLERILGRSSVVAYADDIVLFIRNDAQFYARSTDLRRVPRGLWGGKLQQELWALVRFLEAPDGFSSGDLLGVRITKYPGLHDHRREHPCLPPDGAARASHREVVSLRSRTALILHHLHGYVPPEATIGRLQARLACFVWASEGGVGLLDIAGQLRLACLKGVQASLRGAANGYSWLVRSRTWMTSPAPDVWLSPRRRRLLSLWEYVYSILELNHRILHPASLRSLRLRGDNRFLRLPDLLAPDRWLQMTVGDFSDGAPALVRSTRAALLDAQHLGIFCQRLLQENASSRYHAEYEAETIVLRDSTTPITRLNSQSARRALGTARRQAHPTAELAARWDPTVDVPRSISWADLRRNCFSGHDADVALRLALHALPHPDHPASRRANCAALVAVRPLLREVFASCEMPLDLQAWLFGVGLHPEGMKITSVAKATIYKYHLGVEVGNASQHLDLPTLWERTLAVHRWRSRSCGGRHQ